MEQRLILAAVLVPALAWPACNGGTENLGEGGDGGSAGADLDSSGPTTGSTTRGNGSGNNSNGPNSATGSGGAASGTSTGTDGVPQPTSNSGYGAGGYTASSDGTLPDSGPIGVGTTTTASSSGYGAGGGNFSNSASGYGAGGGNFSNSSWGPTGAGGTGQIGEVYDGAYAFFNVDARITNLINDAEQLYSGGTALNAIAMPGGPAVSLGSAPYQVQLAVDNANLYVCSAGSLYRMSKNGGGTQIYQGADVDEAFECRAVSVDDTMVHAAWFNGELNHLRIASWKKSDRTAPENGLALDDVSDSYQPYLIANDALYYADRTSDELVLGRIALADYADEALLAVDAEFDSAYLQPLAAKGDTLYFQNCEQDDRWCSLFVQEGTDADPTPYEHFQRSSVIRSLVVVDEDVIVALAEGLHYLRTPEAELLQLWAYPGVEGYGPMLKHAADLYFATDTVWGYGSVLWRLPIGEEG